MATVDIRNVRKAFGSVEVLHGVSVDIADSEFVVLVGPSGCGKSTLLRMIAGLENITSGEIAIGKRVVNTLPPKDRDVAMVFQNYALYPHMTVFDNMAFSMKLAKAPADVMEREVLRAAQILGLEQLLHRYPRQLSGGQRQRVAMGRAIVRNPQVFLFDEPLSNLDAKLRVQMRSEIKALHQRLKVTTVYVTHDQIEAMTMADKIVVMNAWRHRASRAAARPLRQPGQHLRGGLHRLAGHERAGRADRRQPLPLPGWHAMGFARAARRDRRCAHPIRHPARAFAARPAGHGCQRCARRADGLRDTGAAARRRAPDHGRVPRTYHGAAGRDPSRRADPAHIHLFDQTTGLRL